MRQDVELSVASIMQHEENAYTDKDLHLYMRYTHLCASMHHAQLRTLPSARLLVSILASKHAHTVFNTKACGLPNFRPAGVNCYPYVGKPLKTMISLLIQAPKMMDKPGCSTVRCLALTLVQPTFQLYLMPAKAYSTVLIYWYQCDVRIFRRNTRCEP